MKDKGLSPQQEMFCQKYVEIGNASKAYRVAYPRSLKWKEKSVWENSSRLMADAKVQSRIQEIQKELSNTEQKAKELILKLCMEVLNGKQIPDYMEETVVGTVKKKKTKGISKAFAMERVAKMLGLDEAIAVDVRKSEDKEMTNEELEAEIKRLEKLDAKDTKKAE